MSQNQFWNLIGKKLAGEATADEISELEELIKSNPELLYAAQHIEDLWKLNYFENDPGTAYANHLKKLKRKGIPFPENDLSYSNFRSKRVANRVILSASICIAILATILLTTYLLSHHNTNLEKRISTFSTQKASTSRLILPDSSSVVLNAGSKISYNEHFGISNRDINLTGEAFFDVKKNYIPFIIHTNDIQVRALGTAFNVKSYPDDKAIETSLIRGKVEITLEKRPDVKYVLEPDQKLIVRTDSNYEHKKWPPKAPLVVVSTLGHLQDSTVLETSWINNKLIFEDEPFKDIAKKMERWYGMTIVFEDKNVEDEHLTGSFEKENIIQALDALGLTAKFHYIIKSDSITITR